MCYTYLVISEAFRLPSNLLFTWFGVALMIGIAVTTVPKRQKLPWSEQENKHPRNRNRKFKLIQSNSITYPNIDINHCFYLHSIETFDISVLAFPDYCCIFMLFFSLFFVVVVVFISFGVLCLIEVSHFAASFVVIHRIIELLEFSSPWRFRIQPIIIWARGSRMRKAKKGHRYIYIFICRIYGCREFEKPARS